MCDGVGRIPSKETVSLNIERDMWRRGAEAASAFLVECHPSVVEALIGLDGENVEDLELRCVRIYVRANFDAEYEVHRNPRARSRVRPRVHGLPPRAQVLEVNVRHSAFSCEQDRELDRRRLLRGAPRRRKPDRAPAEGGASRYPAVVRRWRRRSSRRGRRVSESGVGGANSVASSRP